MATLHKQDTYLFWMSKDARDAAEPGHGVEEESRDPSTFGTTSTTLGNGPLCGTPVQTDSHHQHGRHQPNPEVSDRPQDPPSQRGLAIPTMECDAVQDGARSPQSSGYERCLQLGDRDDRGTHQPKPDHEVPGAEDPIFVERRPLADADFLQSTGSMGGDDADESVSGLGSLGSQLQAALAAANQVGGPTPVPDQPGDEDQGQGQRQEGPLQLDPIQLRTMKGSLRRWLQTVACHNPRNNCFINAVLNSWLWAHLCQTDWRQEYCGDRSTQLLRELSSLPCEFDWATSSWVAPLLRRWGLTGAQGDAAEFLRCLLSYTQAFHVCAQWEKRIDDAGITSRDHSAEFGIVRMYLQPVRTHPPPELTRMICSTPGIRRMDIDGHFCSNRDWWLRRLLVAFRMRKSQQIVQFLLGGVLQLGFNGCGLGRLRGRGCGQPFGRLPTLWTLSQCTLGWRLSIRNPRQRTDAQPMASDRGQCGTLPGTQAPLMVSRQRRHIVALQGL